MEARYVANGLVITSAALVVTTFSRIEDTVGVRAYLEITVGTEVLRVNAPLTDEIHDPLPELDAWLARLDGQREERPLDVRY